MVDPAIQAFSIYDASTSFIKQEQICFYLYLLKTENCILLNFWYFNFKVPAYLKYMPSPLHYTFNVLSFQASIDKQTIETITLITKEE